MAVLDLKDDMYAASSALQSAVAGPCMDVCWISGATPLQHSTLRPYTLLRQALKQEAIVLQIASCRNSRWMLNDLACISVLPLSGLLWIRPGPVDAAEVHPFEL